MNILKLILLFLMLFISHLGFSETEPEIETDTCKCSTPLLYKMKVMHPIEIGDYKSPILMEFSIYSNEIKADLVEYDVSLLSIPIVQIKETETRLYVYTEKGLFIFYKEDGNAHYSLRAHQNSLEASANQK